MQYPNHIKKTNRKIINYANRGMDLEDCINDSNDYYLEINRALIYKKPTPIGVSKASYTSSGRRIDEGYFLAPSTLDYNGLYRGCYIEFEAKETKQKTSFPLANIHSHQILHIRKVLEHGGIVFLLIKMNGFVYLLKGSDLITFIDNETRKSIPYEYLEEKGVKVKEQIRPALNYLDVVDILFKGELEWKRKNLN